MPVLGAAYRKVERITAHNLMSVRRRSLPGIDERVRTFDGQLRACESEHVLRRDSLAQKGGGSESFPHGDDDMLCKMLWM